MKDQPFALIGVNSDAREKMVREDLAKTLSVEPAAVPAEKVTSTSCEKVREVLSKHGIAWRNAVDGGTDGPWATKWNVQGWPTVYMIDAKGVIRRRSHYLEAGEMDAAVDELMKELGKG